MSRVLVTGSSGFLGRNLVRALAARGHEVVCLSRRPIPETDNRGRPLTYCCGDVTEPASLPAALRGVETVYHVAGLTRALTRDIYWRVNAVGVENVAAACARQSTPPVLVHVSSLAAVGPSSDRPLVETARPHPLSEYGRSKLAGEQVAARWADRLPITIVRPPVVFGDGDRSGRDLFRWVTRWGVHFTPLIARPRYSLIHAADLAELLILAAERGTRLTPDTLATNHATGIYFAATHDVAFADFGRLIGKAVGRRAVAVVHVAAPLVWLAATAGEILGRCCRQPLFLNLDKAREATAGSWLCSAARAQRELGFPPAAPLLERLRETADGYRRAGWL